MLADSYRSEGKSWDQFVSDSRNPYVVPEVTDAPLTNKGRLQASALQPSARDMSPPVELVVVSPQCRATQTGLIAFRHLLEGGGGGGKKVFVAHENVREESGVHVCDQRRSISNARFEFPQVDWTGIESDDDPIFKADKRESKAEVGERIYDFLMWLREREEGTVAVASHSGWLMTLFSGVCVSKEELKPWFQTGEMRSVKLVWKKRD
jgi:broad specificity phosphatase PhoE